MQPPPHISPATSTAAVSAAFSAALSAALESQRVKRNGGSYNCGQPKKGKFCRLPPLSDVPTTPISTEPVSCISAKASSSCSTVRRRHSLDDVDARNSLDDPKPDMDLDLHLDTDLVPPVRFPTECLWEVLKRLPPSSLLMAGGVCNEWRKTSREIWKVTEELRIRVPEKAQSGYLGSLLIKCPVLSSLSLKFESDFDSTALGCIALHCPSLKVFEISTLGAAVNRISGVMLSRFIAGKSGLTCLKMEGCSNLGGFSLFSSSLSTLCLEDLHSLSMMIFNCPNLMEISLSFSRQEDDSTDLVTVINSLGRTCTRLQKFHIASLKLSHTVVLALTAANFRELRMLSLILGIGITDASVAAISSSYTNLELLDLSGSSITDTGLVRICEDLPNTLSKLLVVLCPNITASGIQFATSQLPSLELLDCGMTTIRSEKNPHPQKLYIKHDRLKKFCLKGCSNLRTLYLNCPELIALDLSLCKNLQPESLVLNCPKIEIVYVSGCGELLSGAIRKQVIPEE